MELTVECQKRPEGSKPKALRRAGLVPANLYGHKGTESIALTLKAKTVERLLKEGSVNNTLVQLNVTDVPWRGKTLLREVQIHPAHGWPYHLSFFAVAGHGVMDVEVPLHFIGEAVGVKQEGGILDPVLTEIQVQCLPDNIPDGIEIDVSNMQIGDSIKVHELILPPDVTVVGEPERIVVSVLTPQLVVEDTATETESGSAAS